ncbi:MAG TPA: CDP-alcohol phosphatidyltransferase family protein [Polyangiaceae bacterium]
MPGLSVPRLEAWTRAHALFLLFAFAASLLVERPWPVSLAALVSFAVLLVRERRSWADRLGTTLPNALTALRVVIVAALAIGLHRAPGMLWGAVAIGIFILDGLDGWLARRLGGASAFGAHFDMEADAFFVLAVDVELWMRGQLGVWILGTGLLRYLYVLCIYVVPGRGGEMPRSRLGRHAFTLLAIGLGAALALPNALGAVAAALGSAAVVLSFARGFYWSYAPRSHRAAEVSVSAPPKSPAEE